MLTARQKMFIEVYAGNAAEAARAAGYSERYADRYASQLMNKPEIISAIRARENERSAEAIMTREQRQIFWTSIARDTSQRIGDRLRASELLAKSEGDFIERREVTGANGEALIPNTPPITISYEFVKTFQRADGTNINPDEHPEEYAEALRNDFLKDHRERTE
jgi:phage terminase small subunit